MRTLRSFVRATCWSVAASITASACTSEGSTEPLPLQENNHAVSIEISLPPGRSENLAELDTVTVTARVLNAKGTEITTSTLEWRGTGLVALGPRTALLTVPALKSQIFAVFRMDGRGDVSGMATVNARSYPGQVLIWSPGGSIVTMPLPSGAHRIEPRAINDRGEVAGTVTYSANPAESRAFVWSAARGFRELPTPFPVRLTAVVGISEAGLVAGQISWGQLAWTPPTTAPMLWSDTTGVILLPDGYVNGINAAGHLLGNRGGSLFLWTPAEGFVDVPDDGLTQQFGMPVGVDINDNSEVLTSRNGRYQSGIDYGWHYDANAMVLANGKWTAINCGNCVVAAMNNRREVAGVNFESGRAFKWSSQAGVQLLPVGNGETSEAFAINDAGVIAGAVYASRTWHKSAAIWSAAGMTVMPGLAGARGSVALDINSVGQVLVLSR